ncbi:hypothetical protein M8J77_018153 [Diaphorina citri]|nr:hypothetical protein M8J77_018153 [Diaphorina citri]
MDNSNSPENNQEHILTYSDDINYDDNDFYTDDNEPGPEDFYFEDQNSEQNQIEEDYMVEDVNPSDGYYEYEQNGGYDQLQPQPEYEMDQCDDLFKGSSILDALNALAMNGDAMQEEIEDLEQEEQNLTAMTSSANTFNREELNILNENFSILTRKVEEKKRRENVYVNKIIKKRFMLSQDMGHVVQPRVKAVKKKNLQNKWLLEGNERKAKLKIDEKKGKLQNLYRSKYDSCDERTKKSVAIIQDVQLWLKEIENTKTVITKASENLNNGKMEINVVQKEIQQMDQDVNAFDLHKLTESIETYRQEFTEYEEKIPQEIMNTDKIMQTVDDSIKALTIEQDITKTNIEEVIKQIDMVVEEKDKISKEVHDNNSKIQDLHSEIVTNENYIQMELRKLHLLIKEIESTFESLSEVEKTEFKFNNDAEIFQQKKNVVAERLLTVGSIIETLTDQQENIDIEISQKQASLVEQKQTQNGKKLETKKNECYEEIAILEKELMDTQNNFTNIKKYSEKIKADCDQKQTDIGNMNNQSKAQYENLSIDLENNKTEVTFMEQEIEHVMQRYQNEMTVLNKEIQDLQEISQQDEVNHLKLITEIEQDIKTVEETVEQINQIIDEQQLDLLNLKEKIEKASENEERHKGNDFNHRKVINELESALNELINSKNTNELLLLQKEFETIKIKREDFDSDLKCKHEVWDKNKKELVELSKKVQAKSEHIVLLKDLVNNKKEAIEVEETNHKKEEENTKSLFRGKLKKAENNVANLKKSYENKLRIFQSSEIEKIERKRDDTKAKIAKLQNEMEMFREKEAEIQSKIEKKKCQLESGRDKFSKITQVLQDHGFGDMATAIKEEYSK